MRVQRERARGELERERVCVSQRKGGKKAEGMGVYNNFCVFIRVLLLMLRSHCRICKLFIKKKN